MRLSRWFVAVPVIIVAAFVIAGAGDSQSTRTLPIRSEATAVKVVRVQHSQAELAQLKKWRSRIVSFRLQAWNCQDALGVKRSSASRSVWALPMSVQYRQWTASLWKQRTLECNRELELRTLPSAENWFVATSLADRVYPGVKGWLLSCSGGEGGHGGFVMNHQGSGAGGWMQFLSSTFYAHFRAAFADVRARGFIVDRTHESWSDPLGQALTAGYMRTHGMSHHWDAGIDPLCA